MNAFGKSLLRSWHLRLGSQGLSTTARRRLQRSGSDGMDSHTIRVLWVVDSTNEELVSRTVELAQRLEPRGYEYRLLLCGADESRSQASSQLESRTEVRFVSRWHARIPASLRGCVLYGRIAASIEDFEPDLLHTHSGQIGHLALVAGHRVRVPVMVNTLSLRCLQTLRPRFRCYLETRIERWLKTLPHHHITETRCACMQGVSLGLFKEDRCSVVQPGMDLERYRNLKQKQGKLHAAIGIDPNRFLVGILGSDESFASEFGIARAVLPVVSAFPATAFVVLSRNPRANGSPQMGAVGLPDNCRIITDSWEFEDFLTDVELLVSLSQTTEFPADLLRALAAGVPVIGPEIDGMSEYINALKWVSATYFPGNPEEVLQHLQYVHGHREDLYILARESKDYVIRAYDWGKCLDNYDRLFRRLLVERGVLSNGGHGIASVAHATPMEDLVPHDCPILDPITRCDT